MGVNCLYYFDLLNINVIDFYICVYMYYFCYVNVINIYLVNIINGGLQVVLSVCGYFYIVVSKDCLNSVILLEVVVYSFFIYL